MFGKFFETTAVDGFTAWVVKELCQALPPDKLDSEAKQVAKRREQTQERIRREAEKLAATSRLNIYQKAQLGLRLGLALEAAGYPKAFTKPFAYEVVSLVTLASSKPR